MSELNRKLPLQNFKDIDPKLTEKSVKIMRLLVKVRIDVN